MAFNLFFNFVNHIPSRAHSAPSNWNIFIKEIKTLVSLFVSFINKKGGLYGNNSVKTALVMSAIKIT